MRPNSKGLLTPSKRVVLPLVPLGLRRSVESWSRWALVIHLKQQRMYCLEWRLSMRRLGKPCLNVVRTRHTRLPSPRRVTFPCRINQAERTRGKCSMLGTAVHSFIVHGLSQSLALLPLYVLNPGNRRLLNSSESCYILPLYVIKR